MSGRCPICRSYSCSCRDYELRRYQDDHRFTNFAAPVLTRWAQDDNNRRVEDELRSRRVAEQEREEEERRTRRREEEARETMRRDAENEVWERERQERDAREHLEYLFRIASESGRP